MTAIHNRDKYPAIWAEKEAAETELATLMAARKIHTDAIGKLNKELVTITAPYTEKIEQLNVLAMSNYEEIKELSSKIARCAIAMGAVIASRGG